MEQISRPVEWVSADGPAAAAGPGEAVRIAFAGDDAWVVPA